MDILRLRLHNHHLSNPTFKKVNEVVSWFGTVQSQDYQAAKWSLSLRMQNVTDEDIQRKLSMGEKSCVLM